MISDGQRVRALESNAAWASKSADNTLTGVQTLNHPTSGGTVSNAQQSINDLLGGVTDLETLSGSPGAVNHGTFTGSTIADNSTTKEALQDLETSVETKFSATTSVTDTIDNNIGSPEDVVGAFIDGSLHTGAFIFYHINRYTDSKDSIATGRIALFRRQSTLTWDLGVQEWSGYDDDTLTDPAGVTFSVSTTAGNGQVQYISHDLTGTNYNGSIKFSIKYF